MRTLIFGKTGQVARELARACWPKACSPVQLGRSDCDLTDTVGIRRAISDATPQIVVNTAAYTDVDRAEAEPQLAARTNRDAPAAMAESCRELGATLIHLSTDYVFDGSKPGAYVEEDPVAPLSVYGSTKAEGEAAIRQTLERHVILRTSWVFAAHGNNFVRTMLRLSLDRPELRIVCDQHGAPTSARDIAGAVVAIVERIVEGRGVPGVFHFTSAEPTTWFGFAQEIFALSHRPTKLVPIATAEYKTAASRPLNSVLDCGRIARNFGIGQPSWRTALVDVLAEMRETADAPGIAGA
ncbi:MAG TPA: dTDP-4-dehydrorhamnose reductase [Rhizomicrobium sp.]